MTWSAGRDSSQRGNLSFNAFFEFIPFRLRLISAFSYRNVVEIAPRKSFHLRLETVRYLLKFPWLISLDCMQYSRSSKATCIRWISRSQDHLRILSFRFSNNWTYFICSYHDQDSFSMALLFKWCPWFKSSHGIVEKLVFQSTFAAVEEVPFGQKLNSKRILESLQRYKTLRYWL